MGRIIVGGGGGDMIDPSQTTATADTVLTGKKFLNNVGEYVTGTMANQGTKTTSLNCGGSFAIPKGYHDGNGKVTANSLASQTGVDSGKTAIGATTVLSGYQGYVNGTKISGSMANNGAKVTTIGANGSWVIPSGYHNGSGKVSQNLTTKGAATHRATGSAFTAVAAGTYCSGAQTVGAITHNLSAANIKNGAVISISSNGTLLASMKGTFQGYFASATQFYNRGDNKGNFARRIDPYGYNDRGPDKYWTSPAFNTSEMTLNKDSYNQIITTGSTFNFSGYSHVKITGRNFGTSLTNMSIGLVSDARHASYPIASHTAYFYPYVGTHYEDGGSDSDFLSNYTTGTQGGDAWSKVYGSASATDTERIFNITFNATKYLTVTFQPHSMGVNPAVYTIEVY